MPFRIIPERSDFPENRIQSARAKFRYVFDDSKLRSEVVDKPSKFTPQARPFTSDARSRATFADVLAGEPATDDINGNSIPSKSVGREGSDIFVLPHVGPMFRQNFPAERIDFAEGDGLEAVRALKPEAKAAYPRKEVENAELTE